MNRFFYPILFLLFAFSSTPLFAQQQPQVDFAKENVDADAVKRVNRLSDQLKSPFCPGKTLMTCTSSQAFDLRQEMRQMILQGKSDSEILEALRGSFGDSLENPVQPWYTVLVPILPFVFGGLISIGMFYFWITGAKKKKSETLEKNQKVEVKQESKNKLKNLMRED
jgi:cytochrome c-type biogenesis protein CcmH